MKPKRFTLGQQVTPNNRYDWRCTATGEVVNGPRFGEVCTVGGYGDFRRGRWYIFLNEYIDGPYGECWFEPVVSDSVLEHQLEQVKQTAEV